MTMPETSADLIENRVPKGLGELWHATERGTLLTLALLAGLIVALYAPVLKALVGDWWQDPNYSHGFLVPVFAGYVLWQERERYHGLRVAPSNFGLVAMLAAIGLLVVGTLGAELYTSRFSLVLLLAGMVLFLAGWTVLRALAFPLAYLLLMIPIPTIIQNQIVFPLQLLASRFAAGVLEAVGVVVLREGNVLYLRNSALEVAQACSGIRSLVALIALALAYGYLAERRRWVRVVLVLLMLPIAVVSNGLRVVGTGILTNTLGQDWAEGFFHTFSGLLIFLTAVSMMLLAHWGLTKLGRRRGVHASA
jgi:exosortase